MTEDTARPTISDFVVIDAESSGSLSQDLQKLLHAVRTHLGMDVAFVSEFREGRRVFRAVDAARDNSPVKVGGGNPLEDSYCQSIVDGRLPELIPDTAAIPGARKLRVMQTLSIGSYLGVPIKLQDGRVYGSFCCFGHTSDNSLNERDVKLMRVIADLVANRVEQDLKAGNLRQDMQQRIRHMLAADSLAIVYQPIFDLKQEAVSGFESLSRFNVTPARTPDVWFQEAAAVGQGVKLELKAIAKALAGMDILPAEQYVSVNLSPDSVASSELDRVLKTAPLDRVVIEVTEHAVITRYEDLKKALAPLRERGVRVAVDDAGAGYASFRHILNLRPDFIKLDISLTRDIDKDPARRALAAALTAFGGETGAQIVAEGVETSAELKALRALGISKAQGYYLGRPVPLATALELCAPGRPKLSGFTG